ncbi:hypothetical protein N7478_004138 [Penicillium angulare]|uniref:uncharacterized protein n=1 Tax=Penicillium angulare TaxID=116970 RepID=UPI00254127BF|nr:uncharacterized protein N7478_004138 [Penicillium angulare]KAJ5278766.1 hypothetical protein N7478_004138 [Penicillium angulare]
MSGILGEAFTPCPLRLRSSDVSSYGGNSTLDSFVDSDEPFEATGNIEFTTEIRAPTLTGVRPRRANRSGSGFQIHNDGEKEPTPAEKRRRPNRPTTKTSEARKSSLLAQPAQRIRPNNKAPLGSSQSINQETKPPQKTSRLESIPKKQPSHGMRALSNETSQPISSPALKNKVQQNTLYIPLDDSTVPNMFMDLFSPLKKQQAQPPPPVTDGTLFNPLEKRIANQQARKSLTVSARRAPLQASKKVAQESVFRVDIAGKNGGKENIPPGMVFESETKGSPPSKKPFNSHASNLPLKDIAPRNVTRSLKSVSSLEIAGVVRPVQSKRSVLEETRSKTKPSPAPVERRKPALSNSKGPIQSAYLNARASALSGRLGRSGSNNASSNARIETSNLKKLNAQYPKLTEDIKKPALYEDNWLSHQETVITQLVNSLFEHSNGSTKFYDQNTLRLEFLELYHTDMFIHLYRKLQASLSCGTLSIPKQVLSRSYRLRQDIGLRRRFLDIWMHSYDFHALAPAAETVIGRKISIDYDLFEDDRKAAASKLECFLDTFLLRNEDLNQFASDSKDALAVDHAKAYQRTVLRCIVLVTLLDQARQSPGSIVPRQLFVSSSQLKSSAGVLQALLRVLVPSYGDLTKPLAHFGCRLSYKQHQLQEYKYQIENIAVDLRDGVRLTRIVEVLFFTPSRVGLDDQDQTEVTLNSGQTLSLFGEHADVPLSKHLKYPCVSRATKLFNVQIALSALSSIKGSSSVFVDMRPEEIVDGYREKTIAILWALVGSWGLASLVDWDDVQKEILRLKHKALTIFGNDSPKNTSWFTGKQFNDADNHTRLLQQWAALLAGLKGLQIDNLTTSFADGKIYESIVDEYEPYLISNYHSANANRNRYSNSRSLQKRLSLLGCSSQFAQLVSADSSSSNILDRECTLGSLAFLCSRLLTASKRARAATILQRAWRARLESRDIYRRSIAKILATHCAAVVRTRIEMMWAKDVIIRWWRLKLAQRNRKLATRPQASGKPRQNPSTHRL